VLAREAREDLHEERATRLRAESAAAALKEKIETLRRLTPGLQEAHQKHDAFAAHKYKQEESRRTPIPYDAAVKRPTVWGPVPSVLAPFVPAQDRLAGADPLLHVTKDAGYSPVSRAVAASAAPPAPPQLNRHQQFAVPATTEAETRDDEAERGRPPRHATASPALESMLGKTSIKINATAAAGGALGATSAVPAAADSRRFFGRARSATPSSVCASGIAVDADTKLRKQNRAASSLTVATYDPGMPQGPTPVFDPAPETGVNVLSGLVGRSSRRTQYCMGYDGKLVFNGHCERKENEARFKRAAAILEARQEKDRLTREALAQSSGSRGTRRASSAIPAAAVPAPAKIVADRLVRNPNLTVRGEEAYQAEPAGKEGGEKQYPLDRMQYWSSKRTRFYNDHSGKHVMMDECDWPTIKGFVLTGV
jgi:hypothetical protein